MKKASYLCKFLFVWFSLMAISTRVDGLVCRAGSPNVAFALNRTVWRKRFLEFRRNHTSMFRTVAIALVAMATFDLHCLDGKYVHTVEGFALSLTHFMVG
jgi:hypothetical protein